MFADIRTNKIIRTSSTTGYKNNGLSEFGAKIQALVSFLAVIGTAYGAYYVFSVICK